RPYRKYARVVGSNMTWRAWLVLSLIVSAPVSGCRTQKVERPAGGDEPETEALEAPTDAEADADGEAGDHAEDSTGSEGDEISVEEQLAIETMQTHLSRKAASDSTGAPSESRQAPAAAGQPPAGLEFVVVQQGPAQPWVMGIVNRGEHNARLIADPRLLSFEVNVPGKKKSVTCELPDPLRPTRAHARYSVWLEPGQGVVKAFDPRLYCFAVSGQQVLVPGAIVTPKFGWSEKVKTVWKGGKKQQVAVEQSEPFIARIHAPAETQAAAQPAQPQGQGQAQPEPAAPGTKDSSESDEDRGTLGMKGLHAPPIALNSEYQAWSAAALPRPAKTDSPIAIDMQQGSDAASDLYATVEITLKNKSRQTQYVYFRRELLNLEVMGPGGAASCDPEPDTRAPDRQAFLQLAPGQRMSIPSRLVELCPKDTFARPGFYLVHARFEAAATGEEFGLEAYVGRVATEHPANVRIRSGELAPFELEAMRPVQLLE
ncbi:MAG TPA: hypothetical protein VFU02_01425, partial [Polyangiaceae bacterium]|nr:hypothetical protein [Polyangiaceae bacterium]